MRSQHCIGLDLGDGDSALAYCDTRDTLAPLVHGNTTVPTIMARRGQSRNKKKKVLIGDDTFDYEEVDRVSVNFKLTKGWSLAEWRSQGGAAQVRAFAEAMIERLRKDVDWNVDDARLLVGCPSGWSSGLVTAYREVLAGSAVLPRNLEVVPESRSAFVQAWLFEGLAEENPIQPVIVIDIGSSTTDVSVHRGGKLHEDASSDADLGLAELDEAVLDHVVATATPELEDEFDTNASKQNIALLLCRIRKEQTLGGRRDWRLDRYLGGRPWAVDLWTELGRVKPEVIFRGRPERESWLTRYERLVTGVAKRYAAERPIVLMTGGGSNIELLRQITRTAFAESDVRIGRAPEFGVAKGLASYGRLRTWEEHFISATTEHLAQPAQRAALQALYLPMYRSMYEFWGNNFTDAVWEPMADLWRKNELNLKNRGRFKTYALGLFRNWLANDGRAEFRGILDEFNHAVEKVMTPSVKHARSQYPMNLQPISIQLDLSPVELFANDSPGATLSDWWAEAFAFRTIDLAPDWVRRLLGGGFLKMSLKGEHFLKETATSVLASNLSLPDEASTLFDSYVDRGIAAGLDMALADIRVLLLRAQSTT